MVGSWKSVAKDEDAGSSNGSSSPVDNIDIMLGEEIKESHQEWLNYDDVRLRGAVSRGLLSTRLQEEIEVKCELAELLLEDLLEDTVQELHAVFQRKYGTS